MGNITFSIEPFSGRNAFQLKTSVPNVELVINNDHKATCSVIANDYIHSRSTAADAMHAKELSRCLQ
jgi:hypothetical protein